MPAAGRPRRRDRYRQDPRNRAADPGAAALRSTTTEESARDHASDGRSRAARIVRGACAACGARAGDPHEKAFMTTEIRVPQLPESIADATLVTWHKQPGDAIRRDENLADLETDKVCWKFPRRPTAWCASCVCRAARW